MVEYGIPDGGGRVYTFRSLREAVRRAKGFARGARRQVEIHRSPFENTRRRATGGWLWGLTKRSLIAVVYPDGDVILR